MCKKTQLLKQYNFENKKIQNKNKTEKVTGKDTSAKKTFGSTYDALQVPDSRDGQKEEEHALSSFGVGDDNQSEIQNENENENEKENDASNNPFGSIDDALQGPEVDDALQERPEREYVHIEEHALSSFHVKDLRNN